MFSGWSFRFRRADLTYAQWALLLLVVLFFVLMVRAVMVLFKQGGLS